MKIFKKIVKYLISIILALIILLSVYSFITISVFKKSYINVFGYSYFVIASGSMSPAIEVNDIIIIKLDASYKKGDIVTYKSGDSFVTHRVVEIDKDTIISKGDANNTNDENVNKNDIIGTVKLIISSSTLIKILGSIILIFIIISVINFDDIFKKYIKMEKNKKIDSPIEYTQVIPLVSEDDLMVDNIMEETTKYESLDQIINQYKQFKYTGKSASEFENNKRVNKKIIKDVLNVLKLNNSKSKLTTDGAIKLKYIYEIANVTLKSPNKVNKYIDNIPFDELYNYDFNEIGFTDKIRNVLYEMPIYIYFVLMIYSIIYENEFYFDAVYKTLKYRIKIDKDDNFVKNNYKVDKCIKLIENIASKCKNNKFELDKVKELIEINKDL